MNLDATSGAGRRSPLILLVDADLASRHFMWRALSGAFGVLEANNADAAREWIATRPDIDALVVQDELPDQRGLAFVRELVSAKHPIARRAIVQLKTGSDWTALAHAGLTLMERGDLRAISTKLAGWLLSRDISVAKELMREVDRLGA